MKKARFIKRLEDWRGDARLYEISPGTDYDGGFTDYIAVSAIPYAFDTLQPEVMVFPADKDGNCLDWSELYGIRGTHAHHNVLKMMGFKSIT